jgi:23S rRNA (adenine2503-C2)-methyltransferase
MRIEHIRQRLRALGAKPIHEQRVLRLWAQALPQGSGKRRPEDFLPQPVREGLDALMSEVMGLATLRSAHPGSDGSERLLVGLQDGQTCESVLLPRDGLCVSTQVGCAVGCVFCMTGKERPVARSLEQRRDRRAGGPGAHAPQRVKKVVFMGMGEPAHNLEQRCSKPSSCWARPATSATRTWCSPPWATRACSSACRKARVKPALALSLHSMQGRAARASCCRAHTAHRRPTSSWKRSEALRTRHRLPASSYQWTLLRRHQRRRRRARRRSCACSSRQATR